MWGSDFRAIVNRLFVIDAPDYVRDFQCVKLMRKGFVVNLDGRLVWSCFVKDVHFMLAGHHASPCFPSCFSFLPPHFMIFPWISW